MNAKPASSQHPDGNLFAALPKDLFQENIQEILSRDGVRIERIVSKGHTSPASGWYDQSSHEWVIVLKGSGNVQFEDGRETTLAAEDYLFIAAHVRHRETRTDPTNPTIWLAIFWPV